MSPSECVEHCCANRYAHKIMGKQTYTADTVEELGTVLEGDLNRLVNWVSDNGLILMRTKLNCCDSVGKVEPMIWKMLGCPFLDIVLQDVKVSSVWRLSLMKDLHGKSTLSQ